MLKIILLLAGFLSPLWASNMSVGGGGSATTTYDNGTSCAFDLSKTKGDIQKVTLNGSTCNITLSNPTKGTFLIEVFQDVTGSRTIASWPALVRFPGASGIVNGTAPTLTTSPYNYDIFSLTYDGTQYTASYSLNYADSTAPFAPSTLSGLVLWVEATDGTTLTTTTNSAAEAAWNDKSSNGYNFLQATGLNKPTYVASAINSLPALNCDGTNSFMKTSANSSLTGNSAFTAVVAVKAASIAATATPFGWGLSTGGLNAMGPVADVGGTWKVEYAGGNNFNSTGATSTSPQLITITKAAGGIAANSTLRINGAAKSDAGSSSSSTPNISAAPFALCQWADFTASARWNGYVGALVVYSRVLTGSEITSVENYINVTRYNHAFF